MATGFTPGTQLAATFDQRDVERALSWVYRDGRMFRTSAVRRAQEAGLRAARVRDPKLMAALERMAEVMDAVCERQLGRTLRSTGTDFSHRVAPTDLQLVREAYACADRGQPLEAASLLYAAAGRMAGIIQ